MDKDATKPLYGLNYVLAGNYKFCMIVEGLFDMLTGWSHNIPTIATLGEISDEQIELLNNIGIKSLYLAFDNDSSGKKFTNYLKKRLSDKIMVTEVKFSLNKKDINDLSEEEWTDLIKKYFAN